MPLLRLSLAVALLLAALTAAGPAEATTIKQLSGKAGCFEMHGGRGCATGVGTEYVSKTVVSPDGHNVYAISGEGEFGAILSFKRDKSTGALTQLAGKTGCISSTGRAEQDQSTPNVCAKAPGLPDAGDVAISRDGSTVYTLSEAGFDDGQAVDVWRRDAATGALTQIQCLTANSGFAGCEQAPLDLPSAFSLARGGSVLVAAGESITTFPVNADGRLGTGRCRVTLAGDPGDACKSKPRLAGIRPITRLSAPRSGKTLYAAAGDAGDDQNPHAQLVALKIATDGRVGVRSCAGDALKGRKCRKTRALRAAADIAAAPDGRGIYTASNRFVVTDEENFSGYYGSTAVGVFRNSLAQLGGRKGCLLFRGTHNPHCARFPKRRKPGFTGASAIGVTPNGRYVVTGFEGTAAVVLTKRNRKTQVLKPVGGSGGCVGDTNGGYGGKPVKTCAEGHGIYSPTSVAFSPNGRNAYVSTVGGMSVFRLR